jgi:hypothetical protein
VQTPKKSNYGKELGSAFLLSLLMTVLKDQRVKIYSYRGFRNSAAVLFGFYLVGYANMKSIFFTSDFKERMKLKNKEYIYFCEECSLKGKGKGKANPVTGRGDP